MDTWVWWMLGGIVAVVLVAGLTLVVTIRTQFPPLLTAIKRMNRRINRRVIKTAGSPGASASVIHHVGRSSGRSYRTPIDVMPTDDGFAIALPYGDTADWFKNVMRAGSAVLDTEGITVHLADPVVVTGDVVDWHLSRKERFINRLYGIDRFLVLRTVEAPVAAG